MNIIDLAIRRRITTTMVFVGVIILGFVSWQKLPQELLPSVDYPQISVVTSYEKASPEEMEKLATKIIEEAVGTVGGIKKVSSISREGVSLVLCDFVWGTKMDFAALAVREKIDLVKERLPLDASEPIVLKYNPFQMPVMLVNLQQTQRSRSPLELRDFARKEIKEDIQRIDGVASCEVRGGYEKQILVKLDQGRLSASDIGILSVIRALEDSNITYPAGTIKGARIEYLIKTEGEFKDISDIKRTVVNVERATVQEKDTRKPVNDTKNVEGKVAFLEDIAEVIETNKEPTSISRYNGNDSISLTIHRQAETNIVSVCQEIRQALAKIKQELPENMKLDIVYDQSKFVREAISGVTSSAIQGGVLAFLVLLLFLGNIRSSTIVVLSIPVSVMFAFSLMYYNKISINIMSLGGLALGIGMLVDNSIVVIENIARLRQKNRSGVECASNGTKEVTGPIIASTLTTVVVFLPFLFVSDISGQLFKELALTVTFSLVASIFVALFLIPRFAAYSISHQVSNPGSEKFQNLQKKLTIFLHQFLRRKERNMLIIFGLVIASALALLAIPREFMPKVEQRQFIMNVDFAPGVPLSYTDSMAKKIESILSQIPEIETTFVNIGSTHEEKTEQAVEALGSNQARFTVGLKKKGRKMDGIIQDLKHRLLESDIGNAEIEYITQESIFGSSFGQSAPIQIKVKGAEIEEIIGASEKVRVSLESVSGVAGVKSSYIQPIPELKVEVNKDRAALYNLSVKDISASALAAIKGYTATKFKKEGEEIDITVQLREEDRSDFSQIGNILVHSPLGFNLPLRQLANLTIAQGPSEIRREEGEKVVTVSSNLTNRSLTSATKEIQKALLNTTFPRGVNIMFSGETTNMSESFKSLLFVLALALVLVYMIMAAQFESLWQPFIIALVAPLAIVGAVIALVVTGTTLNIVVLLGVVMLAGIVVNNGIVLVSYINTLKEQGMDTYNACIEASRVRLRPILMTTLTTVFGLLPLALGIGEGAELRAPMAIVVMGGLLSNTFFTLIMVPGLYLLGEQLQKKKLG